MQKEDTLGAEWEATIYENVHVKRQRASFERPRVVGVHVRDTRLSVFLEFVAL